MTPECFAEPLSDHCFFAICRELEHVEALVGNGAFGSALAHLPKVEAPLAAYLPLLLTPEGKRDLAAQDVFTALLSRLKDALQRDAAMSALPASADLREQLAVDRGHRRLEGAPPTPVSAPFWARPTPPRPAPQLDLAMDDVAALVKQGSFGGAALRFGALRLSLERHFTDEEERLFPLYLERSPDSRGAVAAARQEHGVLRQLLDQLSATLEELDYEAFLSQLPSLVDTISAHVTRTQTALYPALREVLPDAVVFSGAEALG